MQLYKNNNIITKEQAIQELKELQKTDDHDMAHHEVDRILCELLETAGMADVVAEFDAIEKWYA